MPGMLGSEGLAEGHRGHLYPTILDGTARAYDRLLTTRQEVEIQGEGLGGEKEIWVPQSELHPRGVGAAEGKGKAERIVGSDHLPVMMTYGRREEVLSLP